MITPPTVGRTVLYTRACGEGKLHSRPAIVVRVCGEYGSGVVNLQVFNDSNGDQLGDKLPPLSWVTCVPHSANAKDSTWRFPHPLTPETGNPFLCAEAAAAVSRGDSTASAETPLSPSAATPAPIAHQAAGAPGIAEQGHAHETPEAADGESKTHTEVPTGAPSETASSLDAEGAPVGKPVIHDDTAAS